MKIIVIWSVTLIALIAIIFSLPHILGKPSITITSPQGSPYTTASTSIIIQGTAKNADSLYVEGDEATIASDGSWQKNVLLQSGMNTFDISAKKLLGGTTNIMEQIFYNAPATPSGVTVSSSTTSTPTSTPTTTKPTKTP